MLKCVLSSKLSRQEVLNFKQFIFVNRKVELYFVNVLQPVVIFVIDQKQAVVGPLYNISEHVVDIILIPELFRKDVN